MHYIDISDLQKLLFLRIFILKTLLQKDTDYQGLKNELNMSDGNLWSNMRALEQRGLIDIRKEIDEGGRKVKTVYSSTEKGSYISGFKESSFKNTSITAGIF